MLLGYDWSEDHPQSQSPFFGQFFGLMNNPGYEGLYILLVVTDSVDGLKWG